MKLRFTLAVGLVALAAQSVVLAGCEDDLTPQKTAWGTALTAHNAELDGLKAKHKELLAKLDKVTVKPDGAGGAAKAKLLELVKAQSADISTLEQSLTKASDAVSKSAETKKLADITTAIDGADKDWKAASAKVATDVTATEAQWAALEKAIADDAKAAPAAAPGLDISGASKAGGMLDFSDIDFKVGSTEFDFTKPQSKGALDTLVQLEKTCPEMKVELIGHTDKTGDAKKNEKLSEDRANAVKKYLIDNGIKATQITKTSGVGGKEPLAAEPDPGSAGEKSMDKAVLDAARERNRRISVKVVEHCK